MSHQTPTKPWSRAALAVFCFLFPILEGISNEYVAIGSTGLGVVIAAVWGFECLFRGVRVNLGGVLLAVYLLWNGLSVNWTIDLAATMERVMGLALSLVFYMLVVDTVRTRNDVVVVMRAFAYGVAILGLTAIYNLQQGLTYQSLYGRYSSAGFDPNNFAVMAASTIPILLYLSRLANSSIRALHIAWVLGLMVLCVSSGSRAGVGAMAAALVGYLVVSLRLSEWKNWIFYAVGGIAVVFFNLAIYIPEDSIERLLRSLEIAEDEERVILFHMGVAWGSENLLTGIGAGAFLSASGTSQPHNVFMGAFAELGVPGISLFTMFVASHFLTFFRRSSLSFEDRTLRNTLAISMGCILVGLLTLNWEIRKPVYLILGLLSCFWSYRSNLAGESGAETKMAEPWRRPQGSFETSQPTFEPAPSDIRQRA